MVASKYATKYINKCNTTTKKETKRRGGDKNLDQCLAISRHKILLSDELYFSNIYLHEGQ